MLELDGIRANDAQRLVEMGGDAHVFARHARQNGPHAVDHEGDVDIDRDARRALAEPEELGRERRGARGGLDDRVDLRARGIALAQHLAHELAASEDDRQQVAEVVRDAARHLPEQLHLLQLRDLHLELAQRACLGRCLTHIGIQRFLFHCEDWATGERRREHRMLSKSGTHLKAPSTAGEYSPHCGIKPPAPFAPLPLVEE